MPNCPDDQLNELLDRIDEVLRQARELQTQIQERMIDEKRRDGRAASWTNRQPKPERRAPTCTSDGRDLFLKAIGGRLLICGNE